MVWLALGFGGLLLGLVLLRTFATAPVAAVRQGLYWAAGVAAAGGILAVLLTGRGGQLIWSLLLFGPMLWRRAQGFLAARRFRRGEGGGEASLVETATLAMQLDHATGQMTGRVKQGRFAGRDLAELDLPALLALREECREADAESLPLLEAWLDRTAPDWRAASPPPPAGDGPMTRAEALAVLGLEEGADAAAVRAAHRRLMRGAHPDQGGSDWLAARINQARDLLLG